MLRLVTTVEVDEVEAAQPALESVSAQLSALLAEMVRAPEVSLPPAAGPAPRPGDAVGRFRITRELGRGGFGVVYEAIDGELSRTVALKVVRPGTHIASRGSQWMMAEAEAVARLNHPNIVTLHDLGHGRAGPYLVFELLRGRSLAERLGAGRMAPDEAIEVGLEVSRALVHAHAAGVVHRDLTAANVHLGEDGSVKVLDFGLAHLFGRDGANDGGTPAYMAPEQWEGDRGDARTDLFALGVILFQALSGAYPYRVEKGWSEALEPGETPRLPRTAGPRRLRRLVRSLVDRSPERRPESARAVRDALLSLKRQRDGAGRRRVLWGLGTVAAAGMSLSAWLWARHEPPPGEQVKGVMAAMENGAGEPTLDAVPGLLAAALEPSQRVRLVPPSRLAYASRQAGLGDPGRLDAERARSLARLAGAEVVFSPSAWLEDGRPVIEVRAIESEGGQQLFAVRASPGLGAPLAGAIDRISDRIRGELKERTADRKLRRPVAELVTASAEAARWYYQGVDCLGHQIAANGTLQCAPDFERALALDPSFPLAHYQLAAIHMLPGDSGEAARPHVEAALRTADRLPQREAMLLRSLSERLAGRRAEALAIYDKLLAASPEDPELLGLASGMEVEAGDWEAAVRYLEKLQRVAPDRERPLATLIEAYGRLNRLEPLEALLRQLESSSPRQWRAIVEADFWLDRSAEAVEAARQAVAERGDAELHTLGYALIAAGEFREAEVVARREAASSPGVVEARRDVEAALLGQGRVEEALRWAAGTAALTSRTEAPIEAFRQALIVAATRDPRRVWQYAARAFALDPDNAADLAVVLALLGDLEHAAILAGRLPRGSSAEQQYQALRAWRAGDAVAAVAQLTRLQVADPWPDYGLAPSYLLAEVLAATGDAPGTLAAVEQFRRLPADRLWRAWAFPRSLYLAAAAHEQLGEREQAGRVLDRLLPVVEQGDPSVPLGAAARSLRQALQRQQGPQPRR